MKEEDKRAPYLRVTTYYEDVELAPTVGEFANEDKVLMFAKRELEADIKVSHVDLYTPPPVGPYLHYARVVRGNDGIIVEWDEVLDRVGNMSFDMGDCRIEVGLNDSNGATTHWEVTDEEEEEEPSPREYVARGENGKYFGVEATIGTPNSCRRITKVEAFSALLYAGYRESIPDDLRLVAEKENLIPTRERD